MKNQLLKTISELSPNAAYWMGKRDGYKAQILGLLQQITVADLAEKQAELKSLHWWPDLTNDNFSKEMIELVEDYLYPFKVTYFS